MTGFSLAFLHLYNKKYCQCDDDTCCIDWIITITLFYYTFSNILYLI
jgi:hypothetical protein